MRIKLGPYKVDQDFWQRMQQLPGNNDEQRVLLALGHCCRLIEEQKAKQAAYDAELARVVEEQRKAAASQVALISDDPLAAVPSIAVEPDHNGNPQPIAEAQVQP